MATSLPVGSVAVLIPVKAFSNAKKRLAPVLNEASRIELARDMATRVVHAAQDLPVSVVCDDEEVANWAEALGARVIWCPGRGLNGAVSDGVDDLASHGVARVVIAHSDLPGASNLAWTADFPGVTLVPDLRQDGTNVMCIPTGAGFRFFYGPGSFRKHHLEAERLGLAIRVTRESSLSWDIDTPDDLQTPKGLAIDDPLPIPLP